MQLSLPLQNFSAVGISVEIFRGFDTGVQTSDHLLPQAVTKRSRQQMWRGLKVGGVGSILAKIPHFSLNLFLSLTNK